MWHRKLWLIDHGACLYFHHAWENYMERSRDPFKMIKSHVLLPYATSLEKVGSKLAGQITDKMLDPDCHNLRCYEFLLAGPIF